MPSAIAARSSSTAGSVADPTSSSLSQGANAVALGRAYAYGLGAFGKAGVCRAIDLLAGEVSSTLALMGHASIASLKAAPLDGTLQAVAQARYP